MRAIIPFFPLLFCLSIPILKAQIPHKTEEGFLVPQPGKRLQFPQDHGNHPDYKIEWWYLTGHLQSEQGRQFGFQATFFRFAGPLKPEASGHPEFGSSHFFSTQVALSDLETGRFLFDERFDRDGWEAHASNEVLNVRHGPWGLNMTHANEETMHLNFTIGNQVKVTLQLKPVKGRVIFGQDGTSRKGPEPSARSYYITFPRLSVSGNLILDDQSHQLSGTAWMDHEISSRQLSKNLKGWDWTAIQLNDGREIKAYLLRQKNGEPSPFSQLVWITETGTTIYQDYGNDGFRWKKLSYWESPTNETHYPTTVRIETVDPKTNQRRKFTIRPKIDDQEVRGKLNPTHYWEGACQVVDEKDIPIGNAYLELAGYADSLTDALR